MKNYHKQNLSNQDTEANEGMEGTKVEDAFGNELKHGDSVQTTKELKVRGAKKSLKKGTIIKSIHLTDDPEEVNCPHPDIKGLVLRTEFLKKR